jgi:hypothetical protein
MACSCKFKKVFVNTVDAETENKSKDHKIKSEDDQNQLASLHVNFMTLPNFLMN